MDVDVRVVDVEVPTKDRADAPEDPRVIGERRQLRARVDRAELVEGAARQKTHLDARARSNSESAAPPFDGGAPAADEPGGFQPATTPSQ